MNRFRVGFGYFHESFTLSRNLCFLVVVVAYITRVLPFSFGKELPELVLTSSGGSLMAVLLNYWELGNEMP